VLTDTYRLLQQRLSRVISTDRLFDDPLRTLAYGTDASFYRLIPKLVVRVETEAEVIAVLKECRDLKIPLTFRAAGTSLSGQSLSDSVLVQLGTEWRKIQVHQNGSKITLQPGVVGSHANVRLMPYQRKIGPDPASINSAMIGGIAANNASGMCCGTAQNSYHTVASMRIIFADGSILDTADNESRDLFLKKHSDLVSRLGELAAKTRNNLPLAERIRRKFRIKNTTGYSLNALVDFEDPVDIIQHLMIGSEGTLGFIAEITYFTVPEHPFKASSLMLFPDVGTACEAVRVLKNLPVAAAELMDRASLRSVQDKAGMPEYLQLLDDSAAALLVETRAESSHQLEIQIQDILATLQAMPQLRPSVFTEDKAECQQLWNIRKGLFPSVGAIRQIGTTVIIEDIAFPVEKLASATLDLQKLFQKHSYTQAIIFGHALEGNLHFVFTQNFGLDQEVRRYRAFMDDLTRMVVHTYDGSLKAEHGTGRNMAPFVELEWGAEAYQLMQEIKQIFDPANLLNPGVILNGDPELHIKNLKPLPSANPIVDKCIECGFCEVNCPSRDLTLTPRQRIVVWREIARLTESGESRTELEKLVSLFEYQGEKTCATDGLCATSCPVTIDTGKLIKELRFHQTSKFANWLADQLANHLGLVTSGIHQVLDATDWIHGKLGTDRMSHMAQLLRKLSGNRLPMWTAQLPKGADRTVQRAVDEANPLRVVYFPSCLSRTLGVARGSGLSVSQNRAWDALLRKAGYQVVYPARLQELCCGMPFSSKGFVRQGDRKLRETMEALDDASRGGHDPILFDTSPCNYRMRESASLSLPIYEPAEFVQRFLADRLRFHKSARTVALHVPCSSQKLGLAAKLGKLVERCAEQVIVPDSVGCCGVAGDRGFNYPELAESALGSLKASLPQDCHQGYCTSRTCEVGLSTHSGIPYQSIVYLLDECTEAVETCP
jgi:D-lactate dehydrogenase